MRFIQAFCALAVGVAAVCGSPLRREDTDDSECKSLVEIAASNPDFSTLAKAVTAAGLLDALSDSEELTVFAPTNAAFAKLPKGTLENLLKPENKDQLTAILTYHVVADKNLAKDLKNGEKLTTLNGKDLEVEIKGKKVFVNGAEVKTANVPACNGVIHIIDTVLLPPADDSESRRAADTKPANATAAKPKCQTLVEIAAGNKNFSTLVEAVKAAGLLDALSASNSTLTVFAPTNDAFAKLPKGTLQNLLKPENKDQLTAILTYHVVPGKALSKDLKNGQQITTLNGKNLTVKIEGGKVFINDAQVTTADVAACNGVIHIIDTVLIPPEDDKKTRRASDTKPAEKPKTCQSLVEIAAGNKDFSTLVTAVKAAGLLDALSASKSQLTVFAPTNAAFKKVDKKTLESLLKPENKDQLAAILSYHVVPGGVKSSDLEDGQKIKTLGGQELEVKIEGGKVFINDAQVTTADVAACNGVIHIIDTVLIPPKDD